LVALTNAHKRKNEKQSFRRRMMIEEQRNLEAIKKKTTTNFFGVFNLLLFEIPRKCPCATCCQKCLQCLFETPPN
jgi:hypothetical protein